MEIHSKVYLQDKIENNNRKFGENTQYVPAFVVGRDGRHHPALFSLHDLEQAMDRASRNPEDCGFEEPSFFSKLFGG